MAQMVTRISDGLAGRVDALVDAGVFESRSEAVRVALEAVVDDERRRAVGRAIVEGYRRFPQRDGDRLWSDASTVAMIADEPW